ncbi:hypothetical protein SASPL_132042 [Salvia splendens]|uniref:Uncharacterized protein n=1 Tax=Salvia splendens TaxID=180675 RepID=A0A8X8X8Y0_SALSN|nr:hypothetical protein SASPL_132042 [Salvia splendens]
MACLQLLKSAPSNSQTKISCFRADFSLQKRRIRPRNSGIANNYRRFRVNCKVEDGGKQSNGEEPPESLFMKELRRRGMTPTSLLEEKNKGVVREEEMKFREEDGGWGYSRRNGTTTGAETNLTGQRETSMALNSEGLEMYLLPDLGFDPAWETSAYPGRNIFSDILAIDSCKYYTFPCTISGNLLITAFSVVPDMFGFSTNVTNLHDLVQYFGTEFVHDGCDHPITPPPYVDPYELLEEERMYKTAPPLN